MSQPRFLILETSGRIGQVALAEDDRVLACKRLDEARRHARDLAPAVRELFAQQSWKPKDVSAVLVSHGPGSYTGLRVGIMSAKTFAYATGCALLAIDTFSAIALQAPKEAMLIDVVEDAQQDKVYVQRFVRSTRNEDLHPVTELTIQQFDEVKSRLTSDVWITGPGLRGREAQLANHHFVNSQDWQPRAETLLKIGFDRFSRGERDDLWAVEPLYLRPSAAEEKWRGR